MGSQWPELEGEEEHKTRAKGRRISPSIDSRLIRCEHNLWPLLLLIGLDDGVEEEEDTQLTR